jgi:pimeloyl-ACP methyl ester carboxylesterase
VTRAREPDATGYIERDGVRVFWERYGEGERAILFLPTWSIIHSRCWKGQLPYFGRHGSALTFDPRGNGRSDRPAEPAAYAERELAADALAVLDATGVERAVVVAHSRGAQRALLLAAEHPERVAGLCFVAPALPLVALPPDRADAMAVFEKRLVAPEGWRKYNAHHWLTDYPDFLEFFFAEVFSEPHSTRQIDDCVGWGLDTDGATVLATQRGGWMSPSKAEALCAGVRCPALVALGDADRVLSPASGRALATTLAAEPAEFEGSGHSPHARVPVRFNLLLREFVEFALP